MKKLNIVLILFPFLGVTLSAAPCQHGQHRHNPHCHADISQTATQQSGLVDTHGNTPNPSTNNAHTGSVIPDHHNTQLIPIQTVTGTYGKGPSGYAPVPPKPQPTPHAVPHKVPYPVPNKQPMAVPNQVPNQVVTGTYAKGPTGYAPVPSQRQPTPHAVPHKVPYPMPNKQLPNQVPNQVVTGTYAKGPSGYAPVPQSNQVVVTPYAHQNSITYIVTHTGTTTSGQIIPQSRPTHLITTVNSSKPKPITSGSHSLKEGYGFIIIEPGIQNKEVAVYRSNDAREMQYKDTIKIDNSGGFLLIDHATRDPAYIR